MEWLLVALMGVTLGLLGGGGGILSVPILTMAFGFAPVEATGGSLFIVGVASLVGSIPAIAKREISFVLVMPFATASMVGGFIARQFVVPAIPETVLGVSKDALLMGAFSVLMMIVAAKMLLPEKSVTSSEEDPTPGPVVKILGTGLTIGLVAATLGAGGGFLIVPALTVMLRFDVKSAVKYSLIVISMQSLAGFLGELQTNPAWSILLPIVGVALLGTFLGTALRPVVPAKALKISFGAMVLCVALWVLSQLMMNHI